MRRMLAYQAISAIKLNLAGVICNLDKSGAPDPRFSRSSGRFYLNTASPGRDTRMQMLRRRLRPSPTFNRVQLKPITRSIVRLIYT